VRLGFKETAVRRALEKLRQHGDGSTTGDKQEAPRAAHPRGACGACLGAWQPARGEPPHEELTGANKAGGFRGPPPW
jgi:hypothetical protein